MAARGRPRKLNVPRDSKGRIASGYDRERPDQITATAEMARVNHLLGVEAWKTARRNEKAQQEARARVRGSFHGSSLGRFLYAGEISPEQHDAALWYGELYRDIAVIKGKPSPNIPALDYGAIPGRSVAPDRKPEWVDRRKEQWERVEEAINSAYGNSGMSTRPIWSILDRTIVEDIGPQNAYELGNLRIGLNAINQARGV